MCGIVGYIGERDAYPLIIKGEALQVLAVHPDKDIYLGTINSGDSWEKEFKITAKWVGLAPVGWGIGWKAQLVLLHEVQELLSSLPAEFGPRSRIAQR